MSFNDKVVLITGGGSGIGATTARAFVKAGAKVVLNGRREEKLKQIAKEIDSSGDRITYYAGDIGQRATGERLVETAVGRFGGVDILFNNAGVFEPKTFLNHTDDDLDSYMNLLRGYFTTTQAAIPAMLKRGGGAIVNTGSMWALNAIAATPCSGSSTAKGGVHALTRNLAIEFAPQNIRVNAIAPAIVETPLFDALLTEEQMASFKTFHPLQRNGQPKDISDAVLFLSDSDRSSWVTGIVMSVDGGVAAGRN